MAFRRIVGFSPDLDPTQDGVIKGGSGVVPTMKGVEAAPSPQTTTNDDLTATAVGAVSVTLLDGATRTIIGTPTKLFEDTGTTWTDRSGDTYAAGKWRFGQLGDTTLAASGKTTPIQRSDGDGGTFTTATGAPKATIIDVVRGQVFAFDSDSALFGNQSDRWFASGLYDAGDWVPALATLSVSGRLVSTPGPILAGKRFNDDVAVYKENSMYLGRFVGPPEVWRFDVVSDEIGCFTQEAVVPVNAEGLPHSHFFMGRDNFYFYDGTRPVPIGNPIRDFFFETEIDLSFRDNTRGVWDRDNSRVLWFYTSKTATDGALDKYISYNPRSNTWGTPVAVVIRVVWEYTPVSGPSYDTLGGLYSTYADLPTLAYDGSFWLTTTTAIAIFNASGALLTLEGTGVNSEIIMGDVGEDGRQTLVTRLRPRFITAPATGTLTNSYRDDLGGSLTSAAASVALSNAKFDFEREARWHSFRMAYTGNMEIAGADVEGEPGSLE
jgi:hypothetical protein